MSLDFEIHCKQSIDGKPHGTVCMFERNITHNLSKMIDAAGAYWAVWCSNGMRAGDIVHILSQAVKRVEHNPRRFRQHTPVDGCGTFEGALKFLDALLLTCRTFPDGRIKSER